jgi:hypothetical protein
MQDVLVVVARVLADAFEQGAHGLLRTFAQCRNQPL